MLKFTILERGKQKTHSTPSESGKQDLKGTILDPSPAADPTKGNCFSLTSKSQIKNIRDLLDSTEVIPPTTEHKEPKDEISQPSCVHYYF